MVKIATFSFFPIHCIYTHHISLENRLINIINHLNANLFPISPRIWHYYTHFLHSYNAGEKKKRAFTDLLIAFTVAEPRGWGRRGAIIRPVHSRCGDGREGVRFPVSRCCGRKRSVGGWFPVTSRGGGGRMVMIFLCMHWFVVGDQLIITVAVSEEHQTHASKPNRRTVCFWEKKQLLFALLVGSSSYQCWHVELLPTRLVDTKNMCPLLGQSEKPKFPKIVLHATSNIQSLKPIATYFINGYNDIIFGQIIVLTTF